MSTKISLSASTAVALDFASKLMNGTLNVVPNEQMTGSPLFEASFSDQNFTTEIVVLLRIKLSKYQLSQVEIDDPEPDPTSSWSRSERRVVRLFAKLRGRSRKEVKIATFEVHRDYLDGDNAEGWTEWSVQCPFVHLDERHILLRAWNRYGDGTLIWGLNPNH